MRTYDTENVFYWFIQLRSCLPSCVIYRKKKDILYAWYRVYTYNYTYTRIYKCIYRYNPTL